MATQLQSLPQTGRLEIDIRVSADLNLSAFAARQKVNSFILSDISYMMHAGEPTLVVSDSIYWRVPVVLSLTSHGDVGDVGMIDVNAETGQMLISPNLVAEVSARAEGLAAHYSPETAA